MNRAKPTIYEPAFLNMREVYVEAIDGLLTPYPSIRLQDWPDWSHATGGFRTREFSILCGSTGSGKTTFLANLSAQLLRQGVRHYVMSVETGHHDYMRRILSVLAGEDLNTGDPVHPDKLARIHSQWDDALTSDLIDFSLYENRVSVEQLIYDLEVMHDRGNKLAFIDNLNFFLEVTRAQDALLETDRVIHELILFCKRVDMHLIMVMHPKKTEHGRVESEFDIKGSSTAVQEAHNVFLFNRPKQVAGSDIKPSDRELKLAKMRRRGSHVGRSLLFSSAGTRYSELGYVSYSGGQHV